MEAQRPRRPCSPRGGPGRLIRRRQVFGLTGGRRMSPDLLAVASQLLRASAYDGGRSRLPLRGSPGFSPGSLLPLQPCDQSTDSADKLADWIDGVKPRSFRSTRRGRTSH